MDPEDVLKRCQIYDIPPLHHRPCLSQRWRWKKMLAYDGPDGEKDYSISPYAYCIGNPVRYIDPFGLTRDVV